MLLTYLVMAKYFQRSTSISRWLVNNKMMHLTQFHIPWLSLCLHRQRQCHRNNVSFAILNVIGFSYFIYTRLTPGAIQWFRKLKTLMKRVFFKICQGHHMWFKSEQSIFAGSLNSRVIVPQHEFTRSFLIFWFPAGFGYNC